MENRASLWSSTGTNLGMLKILRYPGYGGLRNGVSRVLVLLEELSSTAAFKTASLPQYCLQNRGYRGLKLHKIKKWWKIFTQLTCLEQGFPRATLETRTPQPSHHTQTTLKVFSEPKSSPISISRSLQDEFKMLHSFPSRSFVIHHQFRILYE
jgi:hypothetical protein